MSQVRQNNRGAHTLYLLLGADRIECAVQSGTGAGARWLSDSITILPIQGLQEDAAPDSALRAALQDLLPLSRSWPTLSALHVVIADCWLAVAGIPWSRDLWQAKTAQPYACSQLLLRGFKLESDDVVRLDDVAFGDPPLTVAYPAVLLAALQSLASTLSARLVSVLPLSVAGWTWAQSQPSPQARAMAIRHGPLLLLMYRVETGRGPAQDVTARLSNGARNAERELVSLWRRLCARDALMAALGPLRFLTLERSKSIFPLGEGSLAIEELAPPQAALFPQVPVGLRVAAAMSRTTSPLDALPRRASVSIVGWLLGAAAIVLAVGLMVQASQTLLQNQSLRAELASLQGAPLPGSIDPSWSRDELQRVVAVNQAIRELNLPISALLQAVQPPKELRVAVLSVETIDKGVSAGRVDSAGQGQGLRIVAQARSGAEMTGYVAFVGGSAPFQSAYLTRHEIDDEADVRPYGFTVEASWTD